jgi:hypothetical protein
MSWREWIEDPLFAGRLDLDRIEVSASLMEAL